MADLSFGRSTEIKPQTLGAVFGAFGVPQDRVHELAQFAEPPPISLVDRAEAIRTATLEELEVGRDLAVSSFKVAKKMLALVAREMGMELSPPADMPEVWDELFVAVAWVPQTLIRRRHHGPEEFDPLVRALPTTFCKEFPELCPEESEI
jgi:hypothetical protein